MSAGTKTLIRRQCTGVKGSKTHVISGFRMKNISHLKFRVASLRFCLFITVEQILGNGPFYVEMLFLKKAGIYHV